MIGIQLVSSESRSIAMIMLQEVLRPCSYDFLGFNTEHTDGFVTTETERENDFVRLRPIIPTTSYVRKPNMPTIY